MRRLIRIFLAAMLTALTGSSVGIVALWLWLATSDGTAWLAREVGAALTSPGRRVAITGISGQPPFRLRIAEIDIADNAGIWLKARDLSIDVAATRLLHGQIRIKRVDGASLDVLRSPEHASGPPEHAISLSLPSLPFAISLDRAAIARMTLQAPLLGQAVTLAATGSAALAQGDAALSVKLDRLDGVGTAWATLRFAPETSGSPRLDLSLAAQDPSGVVIAAIAPQAGALPLAVSLTGKGPIDDWQGVLNATAGREARIDGNLKIAPGRDGVAILLTARAAPGPLVPQRLRDPLGQPVDLDLQATIPHRGPIALTRAEITTPSDQLMVAGRVGARMGDLDLALDGTLGLAPLSGLAARALDGNATLHARITGSTGDLQAQAHLTTHGLGIGTIRIAETDASLTLEKDPKNMFRGTISGRFSQVSGINAPLRRGWGDAIVWSADFSAQANGDAIELTRARIDDAGLHGALAGVYRPTGSHAQVSLNIDDLGLLILPKTTPLKGRATATGIFLLQPDGTLRVTVAGGTTSFHLGVPALDALIGGSPQISATLERAKEGSLTVSGLTISGAQARLSASGHLSRDTALVSASARLTLPRLGALSPAIGVPLSGSATVTADVSGPPSGPSLDATLIGDGVQIRKIPIDRLRTTAKTADLGRQSIDLGLEFGSGSVSQRATGVLSWQDPSLLSLHDLVVTGTAAQASGGGTIDRSSGRITGSLVGRVADLSDWSALVDRDLAGEANFTVTANAERGQSVEARLDAHGLSYGPAATRVQLQHLVVTAALADLATQPHGRIAATLTDGRWGLLTLGTGHLTLERQGQSETGFTAGFAGSLHEPLSIDTAGFLTQRDSDLSVILQRLDGQLGSQPLRLEHPLTLTRHGDQIRLDGVNLALGDGRLTADGEANPVRGRGLVRGEGIDLAPLGRLFGQDEIAGILSIDGTIDGPWRAPTGHVTLAVPALKLAATSHPDLPALSTNVRMSLQDTMLTLSGQLRSLKGEALGVSGAIPLRLDPFAGTPVTSAGPLHLKITGKGRLEDIGTLLPLGEDQIGGGFDIDLRVAGSVAAPQASGRIDIAQGRYDNLATGMSLRGLSLDLEGNEASLDLRRFDANDGGNGRLSGSGRIEFDAVSGPTLDLSLKMTRFAVTRLDTATVIASGTAEVSGTPVSPAIKADIGIDRADIQIPDKLPAKIPTIAVIRINSRHPNQIVASPPVPPVIAGLKITVSAPGNIFISGQGLTSEWRGKVSATGTSAVPNLLGRVTAIRGSYAILGKTFTLQQGTIGFTGGGGIDPSLDILAQRVATDITAIVSITGTASAPGLTLTSTPPLPQDEILSRVLFGTSVGQISTIQALQLAQTAAAFTGDAPDVMSKVRGMIGLDQLTIDSDTSGTTTTTKGGLGDATINGGKYVAPGVFVGIQKGLTPSATKGQVQITVSPHVSVDGAIGAGSSSSSLGLVYRLDY